MATTFQPINLSIPNPNVLSQIAAMGGATPITTDLSKPAPIPSGIPSSLLTGILPAVAPFNSGIGVPASTMVAPTATNPGNIPGLTYAGKAETPTVPPGGATVVGPGGTAFLPGGSLIPPGFNMPDDQSKYPRPDTTGTPGGGTPGMPADVSQWPERIIGIERDRLTMQQEQQKLDEAYRNKLYEYQKTKDTLTFGENKRQFDELRKLDDQRLAMEGLSLDRTFALETAKFALQVYNTPEYSQWWAQTGAGPTQILEAIQSGKPIPVPQYRGAIRDGSMVPEGATADTGPLPLMSYQQYSGLTPSAQAAMRGRVAAAGIPIEDYLAMVSGTVPGAARIP